VDGYLRQARIEIDGGLLAGHGNVVDTAGAPLFVGAAGTVNPGGVFGVDASFTGMLVFGDYAPFIGTDLAMAGTLTIELGSAADFDVLGVAGRVEFLPGSSVFFDLAGYQPIAGDFLEFLYFYEIAGFGDLAYQFPGLDPALDFDVSIVFEDRLRLSFITAVPLPAPIWLLGGGLTVLLPIVRRHRDTAANDTQPMA
jgi:hypothetical protein